jgi:catechol 2,3-dioxygenase-like lactoylglutathione lyase family enzyme
VGEARESLLECESIAGAIIEVKDLETTRAFYGRLLRHHSGEWKNSGSTLRFECGKQKLEFVVRESLKRPAGTGYHKAYRIRNDRLKPLIEEFSQTGSEVQWWREDDPREREGSAYLQDPSGNCVQLLPSNDDELLLDHVGVEVHDLEPAEVFYVKVLGGRVGYYHGRKMDDYEEAKAWGEGKDLCAPWTRLAVEKRIPDGPERKKIPRPNQQVFARYGATTFGLILAREHHQEPPEEMLRGTPRTVFKTSISLEQAQERLAHPDVSLDPEGRINLSYETEGTSLFLRDSAGNFAEIVCGAV